MIKFYCPSCRAKLGVPDEYGGKRIRCSKCNQPSIVPKPVEEISLTPQPTRTGDVVLEPFEKYESSQSPDLPPMDPNAEVLRQISHDRLNKTSGSGAPSENTGRFAFLLGLFKWFQGRFGFGNFYLAVISALFFMITVISVWLALSKLTGLGLEFMFIPTALACFI